MEHRQRKEQVTRGEIGRYNDRQTDGLGDLRQADRWTDGSTEREGERRTDKQTDRRTRQKIGGQVEMQAQVFIASVSIGQVERHDEYTDRPLWTGWHR